MWRENTRPRLQVGDNEEELVQQNNVNEKVFANSSKSEAVFVIKGGYDQEPADQQKMATALVEQINANQQSFCKL